MCLYFLDEMSLAAARQVILSRLKIKTRLFVNQELIKVISEKSYLKFGEKNAYKIGFKQELQ